MQSFKCSSVSLLLNLDLITFISENAALHRYVDPNKADALSAAW